MKIIIAVFLFLLVATTVASANTLTWQDNSGIEDGFAIEMLQAGAWVEVARVGANVVTYSDANTEGVYRVRAFIIVDSADVFSNYSNTGAKLNAPVNANVQ